MGFEMNRRVKCVKRDIMEVKMEMETEIVVGVGGLDVDRVCAE